ncbi:MAG: phosphate regulon transcriptional regulator PhoB [Gammaproteobacteria bacterium]|nr:phosphate regulon transcriptional regulator PhoB [Gammaproteobacteria bacterium]
MSSARNIAPRKVLVVEDEAPVRRMIAFNLTRAGFVVDEAADSSTARSRIADSRPDLVLVDWMLPDSSGIELTRSLRRDEASRELPIILLTARVAERDKVTGLESGADDYITKPFSGRELVARINAVLRRTGGTGTEVLELGDLRLDPVGHRIRAGSVELAVGPTEYRLLKFLMENQERVYSRGQLLDNVWGRNTDVEERTVDVHVRRLRQALEPHGADRYVQTVRGAGYRLSAG